MFNTNDDKRFVPPCGEAWWLVENKVTKQQVYSLARTAYFAVEKGTHKDGKCCGWTLSECNVTLLVDEVEIQEAMKLMG